MCYLLCVRASRPRTCVRVCVCVCVRTVRTLYARVCAECPRERAPMFFHCFFLICFIYVFFILLQVSVVCSLCVFAACPCAFSTYMCVCCP